MNTRYPTFRSRGLTLLEMVIALSLVIVIIGAAVVQMNSSDHKAEKVLAQLRLAKTGMLRFNIDYPCSSIGLSALVKREDAVQGGCGAANDAVLWNGPYIEGSTPLSNNNINISAIYPESFLELRQTTVGNVYYQAVMLAGAASSGLRASILEKCGNDCLPLPGSDDIGILVSQLNFANTVGSPEVAFLTPVPKFVPVLPPLTPVTPTTPPLPPPVPTTPPPTGPTTPPPPTPPPTPPSLPPSPPTPLPPPPPPPSCTTSGWQPGVVWDYCVKRDAYKSTFQSCIPSGSTCFPSGYAPPPLTQESAFIKEVATWGACAADPTPYTPYPPALQSAMDARNALTRQTYCVDETPTAPGPTTKPSLSVSLFNNTSPSTPTPFPFDMPTYQSAEGSWFYPISGWTVGYLVRCEAGYRPSPVGDDGRNGNFECTTLTSDFAHHVN